MLNRSPDIPAIEYCWSIRAGYPVQLFSKTGYAVLQANIFPHDSAMPSQQDFLNLANRIVAMGVAHPDSLCLFGWDEGGVRAINLALNTNRFKVLSVCSGYDAFFPEYLPATPVPSVSRAIDWPQLTQTVLNSDSFAIKGFHTPIQILLSECVSCDENEAAGFTDLLSSKGCPTELDRIPASSPHDVITLTERLESQVLIWFEHILRGKKYEKLFE
jgi:hypothetical protein